MPTKVEAVEGSVVERGYQQITSLSSSTALTVPENTTFAMIGAESQAVRYRADGTAPTASVGKQLAAGQEIKYTGDLKALRFIEVAASAKLNISYYGVS
jgi:hypothetical protein